MKKLTSFLATISLPIFAFASEADLVMPAGFSSSSDSKILYWGFLITIIGLIFGFWQFNKVRKLKAHKSMLEIGNVIFKTCSTYLKQQGKFLVVLFLFIGAAIALYFGVLSHMKGSQVLLILAWTVIGILGSYAVAWFGVRMNTYANARMAFASLRRRPLDLLNIPLRAGMGYGGYGMGYGGYGYGMGYGGYGYGGYGGYGYSNYYSYALASMYSSANSGNSTTKSVEMDKDRYFNAVLNGPESKNGRVPTLKIVYALPKAE